MTEQVSHTHKSRYSNKASYLPEFSSHLGLGSSFDLGNLGQCEALRTIRAQALLRACPSTNKGRGVFSRSSDGPFIVAVNGQNVTSLIPSFPMGILI